MYTTSCHTGRRACPRVRVPVNGVIRVRRVPQVTGHKEMLVLARQGGSGG